MSHSTARPGPGANSREEDVADLPTPRREPGQGVKPRRPVGRPAGDGGLGPDEPDEGEFDLAGDDDLGPADLGPAAPNFHDPDADSGRTRK